MSEKLINAEQIFDYIHAEVKRTFNLELSRRDFIKLMSGGMLGAVAAGLHANNAKAQNSNLGDASIYTTETMPNGIASGDITQTSAMLWTRSTVLGTVRFQLLDTSDNLIAETSAEVTEAMLPVKVLIADLQAGTAYRYRVIDAADSQLAGQFRTLSESGTSGLRFGVSGDWRGELRPYVALANIPERDLDFFVALGDTIYADDPSIDFSQRQARTIRDFRIKHNEVYSQRFAKNYWAAARASTPIYCSIDDHEVSDDFAGGASPSTSRIFANESVDYINQTSVYRNGLQVFSEYNPLRDSVYEGTNDPRIEGRPKLYRYLTEGDEAAIFILDARSFRDEQVEGMQNLFSPNARNQWQEDVWQSGRTMLGQIQLNDLKRDLLDAQERGIIWKFVMMPEPIQQMGWLSGEDRWEGYAPERTEVLQYIEDNGIQNVVFVSADIHSTFISDLTYQTEAFGELIRTSIWEISTGSVAYYPPSGQAAMEIINELGVMLPYEAEDYNEGDIHDKDAVLERVFNRFVIATQGLKPLGLEESQIDYELLVGVWTIGHSFGWTEFEIDAESHILTVTTYGVPSYTANEMSRNPNAYINTPPEIFGQMRITPIL